MPHENVEVGRNEILLDQWVVATGPTSACLNHADTSCVLPHTINIEPEHSGYHGKIWYRTALPVKARPGRRAFLAFEGACRDVRIAISNKLRFAHTGSGYTPFTVEITKALPAPGAGEAAVTVCCDNSFSQEALPFDRSFDWPDDGGLIRPVKLVTTGPVHIHRVKVAADPLIHALGKRKEGGSAAFGFTAYLSGEREGCSLTWQLYRGAEDSITSLSDTPLMEGKLPCTKCVTLEKKTLQDIVYWHFDRPELYTLVVSVYDADGTLSDRQIETLGFRMLQLSGSTWLFNGEPVRLPGMEWMPGSDPHFGLAEPLDVTVKMLSLLRDAGCVITRFHWQQSNAVYNWCDRHGLMVQEEIPFWGKQPEGDPEKLLELASSQLEETVYAHENHPSIFAWGVGNELSAQTEKVRTYVRRMVEYCHLLDPLRLCNYVTNTAWQYPKDDGTKCGDVMMINDYIGTWHQGYDPDEAWKTLVDAHPGRAFLPAEFGLCEPAFPGGDEARRRIFLEKLNQYRRIPQIVGTIYFCLNDYRTHMGEEGEGVMRRRVHGSADLYGNPKPSYETVKTEYTPFVLHARRGQVTLTVRSDIPCYSLHGYRLVTKDMEAPIPDLLPGEAWTLPGAAASTSFRICRADGSTVYMFER